MKKIAIVVSGAALGGTILPAVLFMADRATLPSVHWWMLISTIVWFVSAPLWIDRSGE
jgi:hypothetical protein